MTERVQDKKIKKLENDVRYLLHVIASGGVTSTFTGLTDGPGSFSGNALEVIRVNAAETALEYVALAGGGDALTADPLSQFAATTSAQLASIISNETGTGALVFNTQPLFVTPRLAATSTTNYIWTATDALGNGSFQAAPSTLYSGDGTIAGDRTITLNGNAISVLNGGAEFLHIDPTPGSEHTHIQAFNTTGGSNYSGNILQVSNTTASASFASTFNAGAKQASIIAIADVSNATIAYSGDAHTFTGTLTFNDLAGNGVGFVAVDNNGLLSWSAGGGGMTNPLTTTGDVIYSSSGTTPARLAIGTSGFFLKSNGTTPVWDSINIVVTGVGTGEAVLYDLGTDILYHKAILGSSLINVATVTDDIVITLDSTVSTASNTQTLTNKRITARYGSTTSSATPTINTDNVDVYELTAQAVDITSFTTNLTGTPTIDQTLHIIITGTAARAITWGASFEASTVALPTTTVSTDRLDVFFVWTGSIWRCGGTW